MRRRNPKQYDDDDGRTIVDMSQVPDGSLLSGWTSGASRERKQAERKQRDPLPGEDVPVPPEERRMFLKGTMRATLLIGLAYLAGLGLVIWLMTLIW